jgi:hypothetical protein
MFLPLYSNETYNYNTIFLAYANPATPTDSWWEGEIMCNWK